MQDVVIRHCLYLTRHQLRSKCVRSPNQQQTRLVSRNSGIARGLRAATPDRKARDGRGKGGSTRPSTGRINDIRRDSAYDSNRRSQSSPRREVDDSRSRSGSRGNDRSSTFSSRDRSARRNIPDDGFDDRRKARGMTGPTHELKKVPFGYDAGSSDGYIRPRTAERDIKPAYGTSTERGSSNVDSLRDNRRGSNDRDSFPRRDFDSTSRPSDRSFDRDTSSGVWDSQDGPHEHDPDTDTSVPGYTTAASDFLYGRRSILAALKSNKRKFYNLYLRKNTPWDTIPEGREILDLARKARLSISFLHRQTLDTLVQKTSRQAGESVPPLHDGLCLEASPFPQLPLLTLGAVNNTTYTYDITLEPQTREDALINGQPTHLTYPHQGWRHPFLLWLHGTVDMRNVGAIMRTCLYFGIGVIMSKRGTAGSGFLRTSAGASEFLDIMRVSNETTFIEQSRENGWTFWAAVAPSTGTKERVVKVESLAGMRISPLVKGPCVVVVGNEDLGLPPAFVRMCDNGVSIGGRTKMSETAGVDSLNVGVAAALLVERFVRQPSYAELRVENNRKDERLF